MRRREDGFTLIELAVALGLFAIAVIGLSLLFDRALESTTQVRFDQLGKTLAQRKLEEVRSHPYFISQKENPGDVDVLDRYFPGLTNGVTPTGAAGTYDATANVWKYTSIETVTGPEGPPYQRTVDVQFVVPLDTGTIQVVAPVAGYDSNDTNLDQPATEAVRITVTVSRNAGGTPRSVSLDTVMTGTQQEPLAVEASGSVLGAQVSGLTFVDGDDDATLVPADVIVKVGEAGVAYREAGESTSQGSADPVDVLERDPVTSVAVQPEAPGGGTTSSSVPNSTTGNTQSGSASLSAGSLSSVNAPVSVIAAWDGESPSGASEARVSALHSLNPEGRATVSADQFLLNSRDKNDAVPEAAVELGVVSGLVEQRSTTSQSSVTAEVDLEDDGGDPAVTVWAAPQFLSHPDFEGVVTIDALHVDAEAIAASTSSSTEVNWTVEGLSVWDPNAPNGGGPPGAYGPSYTFGFRSDCGGWVSDPNLCGPLRTDGLLPFENPNPVILPIAYAGVDAGGTPTTSVSIVAGVTVRDSAVDLAAGASNASVAQKNIVSITTRNDVVGAAALEPMLLGLGDATMSVSYVSHQH